MNEPRQDKSPAWSGSRLALVTAVTLVAFAGNSILARMAIKDGALGPVDFTALRLLSGAVFLAFIILVRTKSFATFRTARWQPAATLALYAISFSVAYVSLDAGTGALLLFSATQATMLGAAILRGDRPGAKEWVGMAAAMAGLVYLLSPGLSAPPATGAMLMLFSGLAWGLYSLSGQGESDPAGATARNFVFAAPFALVLLAVPLAVPYGGLEMSPAGISLALISGMITSGLGYILWFAVLRQLTTNVASIVQLSIPAIAALGGIALMGEPLTPRFVVASGLILGGIFVVIRYNSLRQESA